ncbi:unnamed protein product [Vitrella brassicaformis CCMP3155]|uniref:protein-ribulosamine 3-kinase n=2 Tax=Vitrella brassicaformis TaxID=1169539 RepID=A0A0G4EPS1_VITBC|nr:unnamed protein product [Vitrella brassicaformis CCMP3155]|eukprot:CEL99260.1 unnamed protein product [Vitrella brassicaformis CCMP3155]
MLAAFSHKNGLNQRAAAMGSEVDSDSHREGGMTIDGSGGFGLSLDKAEKVSDEEIDGIVKAMSESKGGDLEGEKYQCSTADEDPIVKALKGILGCEQVTSFELLDSRWNGNEAVKYMTDKGPFFVKMNRVEHLSVFMQEAVSLTAIAKTNTLRVPKPLHVGVLPKVGSFGPGSFMVLDYLPLIPFGSLQAENQKALGRQLADLHLDDSHDAVHAGRFGFVVNSFLSLTPLNNTWTDDWCDFLARRLGDQLHGLYVDKAYGRAPLDKAGAQPMIEKGERVIAALPRFFADLDSVAHGGLRPSLLHGDLWIGNTGATGEGQPTAFDPASFFGHHEFDLALAYMFGGFRDEFYQEYHRAIPRAPLFESRQLIYQLYQYLNQLNLFGDPRVKGKCEELMDHILSIKDPASPFGGKSSPMALGERVATRRH